MGGRTSPAGGPVGSGKAKHTAGAKSSLKQGEKQKDNQRKKGGRSSQQRADGRGKLKLALQTAQWHLNLAQGQVVTLQAG